MSGSSRAIFSRKIGNRTAAMRKNTREKSENTNHEQPKYERCAHAKIIAGSTIQTRTARFHKFVPRRRFSEHNDAGYHPRISRAATPASKPSSTHSKMRSPSAISHSSTPFVAEHTARTRRGARIFEIFSACARNDEADPTT